VNRRAFISRASSAAVVGFFAGRIPVVRGNHARTLNTTEPNFGYGPLVRDRKKLLDLPEGFSYEVISRMGEKMSDGFYVPGFPDGMGAFPGPEGTTIILRNHEFRVGAPVSYGPFKGKQALMEKVAPELFYDAGLKNDPCQGSVTTLVYDTQSGNVKREFLSLAGTLTNCSGGRTPWGTWISCEESVESREEGFAKDHGYAFEVLVSAEAAISQPIPLRSLGRFVHEGIAVVPETGIVYETEDRPESLFYRFIPDRRDQLTGGGRLQALAFVGKPHFDTRNWKGITIRAGERSPVHWIDLDDVDSPIDNLRFRGYSRGASRFARGEGAHLWEGSVCFGCTTGGPAGLGQVFRYWPSPFEGSEQESDTPAEIELFFESTDKRTLENPDQFGVTPRGDLLICEDGEDDQFIKGITPQGDCYPFARNARDESELTGVCFSPDGSTLFVNNLLAGLTFAVTGTHW
jgi:secreted PhoX family phosphatase